MSDMLKKSAIIFDFLVSYFLVCIYLKLIGGQRRKVVKTSKSF